MPNSPPPPESPVKDVDRDVGPGSLSRFKNLASRLFGIDPERFRGALSADKAERAKRRALSRTAPRAGRKDT